MNEINANQIVSEAFSAAVEYFKQKKHPYSIVILEQLLKCEPDHHDALQLYGINLQSINKYDEAIEIFTKCLKIEPENVETLNNLALSVSCKGQFKESVEIFKSALKIRDCSYIYNNLALQYRHLNEVEKSIKCLEKSNQIKESATTWAMLGGCYGELKNLDKSEFCLRKALEIDSGLAGAHVDLASIHHLRGEWAKGFAEYEYRHEVYDQLKIWSNIYNPQNQWRGQKLEGKSILVHCEQGHGDAVNFCRYLPYLQKLGAYVIFQCSESLKTLMLELTDQTYCVDPLQIPTWQERLAGAAHTIPNHDYHCSLISLPHLLNNPPIIGARYLNFKNKYDLSNYNNQFKIGIVWAGNPQHPNDKQRSCHLKWFRETSSIPNVKLFSLMKDTRSRAYFGSNEAIDLTAGCENMGVVDMSFAISSFEDTASIINALDLVIGVDTSVLHLAGALGKRCINMLPWNPDWRWCLEGENTVWYDSMTLVRPDSKNCWTSVFSKVKNLLQIEMKKATEAL